MKILPNPKARRGFTLVEILIAMAIFMVIMTAIYSSWTAILRSSKAGLKAAAEVQRTRTTVKCVEDAIAATVYFTENAAYYSFETDTSTDFAYLSLVSRLPSSFPGSGLFPDQPTRRVTFEVVPGASGNNELHMAQSSLLQVLDDTEAPYTITLATNISHFTLEFWDDQNQDWAYEWLETNSVPRMIKVSLGFGAQNQNNLYGTKEHLETKTIYLAGTAITKEIQSPTPAAAGGRGAPGRGGGGPGGGGAGGNGAPTIRIGPDGRPIITPGGDGQRNRGGNFNNNDGRNNNRGGNFPPQPGNGQGGPNRGQQGSQGQPPGGIGIRRAR